MLLLDEPSNDLDVETLRALEDALLEFPGSVMVISHDRWFLDRIATHILAFEGDSQVVFFDGNYQEYEADKAPPGRRGASPSACGTKAEVRRSWLGVLELRRPVRQSKSRPVRAGIFEWWNEGSPRLRCIYSLAMREIDMRATVTLDDELLGRALTGIRLRQRLCKAR